MNSKPPLLSTLATFSGCAIVCGSLLLTVVFPQLHLGVLVVVGGLLGSPLIVLGLRLHSRSIAQEGTEKSFWPTGTEIRRWRWGSVAIATFLACFIGPAALAIAVGFLLPPGDQWSVVALRLVWIASAVAGGVWWVKFVSSRIPSWFRGRVSDEMLAWLTHQPVAEEVMTAKAAAIRNWQLVVVAGVAFSVAFGAIDFDSPWLDIDGGVRRTRGLLRVIQWCRGNPNTVTSSAVLVGTAASAWYVYQIGRAMVRSNAKASG